MGNTHDGRNPKADEETTTSLIRMGGAITMRGLTKARTKKWKSKMSRRYMMKEMK